jgi:hypothetical protein
MKGVRTSLRCHARAGAYEEIVDPLIPADAGIQTLPNHWHLMGQRLLGWTAPYGIDVPE